jgi:hypothetical protein
MRELVLLLRGAFGERLFSAADLAALVHPATAAASPPPWELRGVEDEGPPRPAGEELGQALRAALEGATGKALPPGPAATARLVGKRLQMVVGRPVDLGEGQIGTILRARAGHDGNAYRVAAGPGGGS